MINWLADFFRCLKKEKKKFVYKDPPSEWFDAASKITPYWAFKFFSGSEEKSSYSFPALYYDEYNKAFVVTGPNIEVMVPTLAHAILAYQEKFKNQCRESEESWLKKNNRSSRKT